MTRQSKREPWKKSLDAEDRKRTRGGTIEERISGGKKRARAKGRKVRMSRAEEMASRGADAMADRATMPMLAKRVNKDLRGGEAMAKLERMGRRMVIWGAEGSKTLEADALTGDLGGATRAGHERPFAHRHMNFPSGKSMHLALAGQMTAPSLQRNLGSLQKVPP